MALNLFISNSNLINYLSESSLQITDQVDSRNTATFRLRDTNDGNPAEPAIGAAVQIGDTPAAHVDTTTEAVDISETAIDVNNHALFTVGLFYLMDKEIMKVTSGAANVLTVQRAAMGSIAATHPTASKFYLWTAYFAGSVDTVGTTPLGTDKDAHNYAVNCVDWNQIADRFLALKTLTAATSGAMAISLVNDTGIYPQARIADTLNSMEGVIAVADTTALGLVQPGVDVDEMTFNYTKLTDALNDLAKLTGYFWNINYNKELVFGQYGDTVTAITEANKGTYIVYGSEAKQKTRDQYRNVQFLRGGAAAQPAITQTFNTTTAASWLTHITLTRPVGATIADADIKDDGVNISGGVGVKDVSTGKGAYYKIGSPEIEIAAAVVAGSSITVTYQGQTPIMTSSSNEDAITERASAEGNSGSYAAIETDPDINSLTGFNKGRALVERYGTLPSTVTYTSDTVTWIAGSKQTVTLDSLNVSAVAYIITSRTISDRGAGNLRASYVLEDSLHRQSWVDWYTKIYNNQLKTFATNDVLSYGRTYETEISKPAPF